MTIRAPIVEVFVPSKAPHLAQFARSLEPAIVAELDRLPPPTVMAFIEAVVEQRELEEAFDRFRRNWWRKLGIERNAASDTQRGRRLS